MKLKYKTQDEVYHCNNHSLCRSLVCIPPLPHHLRKFLTGISAAAQDGGPPDGGPPDGRPPHGRPMGGPGGLGGGHHGPGGPPPWEIKKHLTCPTSGGTATVSIPCPTGPPPTGKPSHPHSRPTDMPTGHHKKWDGTITVYPSGAPEVTKTLGIDCAGESGPSCSQVIFASMTCAPPTNLPKPNDFPSFSHKSFPTVTASAGETKTVHAHGPPTCKAAEATAA